jgi:hypothetical protein
MLMGVYVGSKKKSLTVSCQKMDHDDLFGN